MALQQQNYYFWVSYLAVGPHARQQNKAICLPASSFILLFPQFPLTVSRDFLQAIKKVYAKTLPAEKRSSLMHSKTSCGCMGVTLSRGEQELKRAPFPISQSGEEPPAPLRAHCSHRQTSFVRFSPVSLVKDDLHLIKQKANQPGKFGL